MKKVFIVIGLLAIVVTSVVGCSKIEAAPSERASKAGILSESYANALPVEGQLVVGTLRLEAGVAVDAAQAGELRPLWMAFRSLSESDSASPTEVEALVDQIQDTMTEPQLESIAEMALTGRDLMSLSEELGIEMAAGVGRGMAEGMTEEQREAMRAQFAAAGGAGEGARGGVPGVGGTTNE